MTSLLAMTFYLAFSEGISNIGIATSTEIPEQHMIIEGYVVSKSWDGIWVAKETANNWERLTSLFTRSSHHIFVSRHQDIGNKRIFQSLTINESVQIYCDYLRESNPGKTSAYYIESIS